MFAMLLALSARRKLPLVQLLALGGHVLEPFELRLLVIQPGYGLNQLIHVCLVLRDSGAIHVPRQSDATRKLGRFHAEFRRDADAPRFAGVDIAAPTAVHS